MRYAIMIEKAEHNDCAYVPDLPGCIATGAAIEQVKAEIRETIELRIEGMREDGIRASVRGTSISYFPD